jgi:hypothetical protein
MTVKIDCLALSRSNRSRQTSRPGSSPSPTGTTVWSSPWFLANRWPLLLWILPVHLFHHAMARNTALTTNMISVPCPDQCVAFPAVRPARLAADCSPRCPPQAGGLAINPGRHSLGTNRPSMTRYRRGDNPGLHDAEHTSKLFFLIANFCCLLD